MSKHILIISTSPREKGNSHVLAEAFLKGVKEGGNEGELISLHDKTIGFCKGCFACQKTGHCIIKDDAEPIAQKMKLADAIVFATPIYYYEMCGQMKTMLDRGNPLFSADYAFRDIYLLASAADEEEHSIDGAVKGLSGWVSCFEKARLAGMVFAGGVNEIGDIKDHVALDKAYEMGKHI